MTRCKVCDAPAWTSELCEAHAAEFVNVEPVNLASAVHIAGIELWLMEQRKGAES